MRLRVARHQAKTLPQRVYHTKQGGFSLLEVLLIIAMLSAMILPFTLLYNLFQVAKLLFLYNNKDKTETD